jgi:hypothetical protein
MTVLALNFIPGDSVAAAVARLPTWAGNHHNSDVLRIDSHGIGHEDRSTCWLKRADEGSELFGRLMVDQRLCQTCYIPSARKAA